MRFVWLIILATQLWDQGLALNIYPSFNETGLTTHETLIISRQHFPSLNRFLMLVNNSIPGPAIYVPLGNVVRIVVKNEVYDDATAIHWHGMSLTNYSWADGSTNMSQCAISNVEGNNSLVYEFIPETAGTFFYHGHYHSQQVDGLIGALIIQDEKEQETFSSLGAPYTIDNADWTFLLFDYYQTDGRQELIDFLWGGSFGFDPIPDAFTVNGYFIGDMWNITHVNRSEAIRVRVINSAAYSTFIVSIDGLPLTLIELDGIAVEPLDMSKIKLYAAQRASFVVDWSRLNQTVIGSCSIYLRFELDPSIYPQYLKTAANFNIYGSTTNEPVDFYWKGLITFNDSNCIGSPLPSYTEAPVVDALNSTNQNILEATPLYKQIPPSARYNISIVTEFYLVQANGTVRGFINDGMYSVSSNYYPVKATQPLLYSIMTADSPTLYSPTVIDGTIQGSGAVPFVLPYNEVIDIYIDGACCGAHPFHLHGHHFWIISTNEVPNACDLHGGNCLVRDVVTVPFGGWAIIRIISNNPGVWIFHCHLHWHFQMGLAATFIEAPDILYEQYQSGANVPPEDHVAMCSAVTAIYRSELESPTWNPTRAPTSTAAPSTLNPTVAATLMPSATPSRMATTEFPLSAAPTEPPSTVPTMILSSPTGGPATFPPLLVISPMPITTVAPSSMGPTSATPSVSPTMPITTVAPSSMEATPSVTPTTFNPSPGPTTLLSSSKPSTGMPSTVIPSTNPTQRPSEMISADDDDKPSLMPSYSPASAGSSIPTIDPSRRLMSPSSVPSLKTIPTSSPTLNTMQPTSIPTYSSSLVINAQFTLILSYSLQVIDQNTLIAVTEAVAYAVELPYEQFTIINSTLSNTNKLQSLSEYLRITMQSTSSLYEIIPGLIFTDDSIAENVALSELQNRLDGSLESGNFTSLIQKYIGNGTGDVVPEVTSALVTLINNVQDVVTAVPTMAPTANITTLNNNNDSSSGGLFSSRTVIILTSTLGAAFLILAMFALWKVASFVGAMQQRAIRDSMTPQNETDFGFVICTNDEEQVIERRNLQNRDGDDIVTAV